MIGPAPHPTRPSGASLTRRPRTDPALEHLRVVVFSDAIPGRNGVGTYYDDLAAALGPHVGAIRIVAPTERPGEDEKGWSMRMPGDGTQRIHIPWVPHLWRQVHWTRPHVVLAATPSLYGVTGLLMAARLRVGGALCYHTEFPKIASGALSPVRARVVSRLLTVWDDLLVRRSPRVLAPNAELAAVLAGKGRADARVVGTLAPPAFIATDAAPPPAAVESILFVGRLSPEKRIDQVIATAERIPGLGVRIVGDGPMRSTVEAAAERLPNLAWTPWTDRPGVMAALDATDLVVLPSRHETFGTAAFEGMTRGRPTLVSPDCGITGWPTLRRGLHVMRPGEALPDAIERVRALAPEELAKSGRKARLAAMRFHDETVDDWLALLAELAQRGRYAG